MFADVSANGRLRRNHWGNVQHSYELVLLRILKFAVQPSKASLCAWMLFDFENFHVAHPYGFSIMDLATAAEPTYLAVQR